MTPEAVFKGTVTFFHDGKALGWIAPDDSPHLIYFHRVVVRPWTKGRVEPGTRVEFTVKPATSRFPKPRASPGRDSGSNDRDQDGDVDCDHDHDHDEDADAEVDHALDVDADRDADVDVASDGDPDQDQDQD